MTPGYNFPAGTSRKDPVFSQIDQMISGYRGYESIDDMWYADRQIRDRLADQLDRMVRDAESSRRSLEKMTRLSVIMDFDDMVRNIMNARREMESRTNPRVISCQSYTPSEEAISKIHALDFKMLSDAENSYNLMQEFGRIGSEDLIRSNMIKITMSVKEIVQNLKEKDGIINCMIS